MKVLMDIYDKKDIPSNKTSDRMIERLTRFISDTINAIEADIHNARTKHYGVFDSLSKFMRKNKLASTVDLTKADMEIAKKYEKNKKTNIWEFDELP